MADFLLFQCFLDFFATEVDSIRGSFDKNWDISVARHPFCIRAFLNFELDPKSLQQYRCGDAVGRLFQQLLLFLERNVQLKRTVLSSQ